MKIKRFIQLIFTFVKTNQYLVLQDILQTDRVVLSGDKDCFLVQLGNVEESYHLTSNQEEADTKVILRSLDVLNNTDMFFTYVHLLGTTTFLYWLLAQLEIIRKECSDYGNGDHQRSI